MLFLLQDESLQFLKEEKADDAIYSIYLKKICYHSAFSERSKSEINESAGDSSNSTFYTDLYVSSACNLM